MQNHKKDEETQGNEPTTMKEPSKAISKLQRGNSIGPDEIPDEVSIESNCTTRELYLEVINHIHQTENIPRSWLQGNIKKTVQKERHQRKVLP